MQQQTASKQLEVEVPSSYARIYGLLALPPAARGIVLFAHGSGSGRFSPRNNFVAQQLHEARFATLLMDLLTEEEEGDRRNVFDIGLLARRMLDCTQFVKTLAETSELSCGYFGASTGAGAALVAAAESKHDIAAVVSRGGRPDLAGDFLSRVRAPTLLIVGGDDFPVIGLNEDALARLRGTKKLEIVPGASHLFEEPGTLEQAARLAVGWFDSYLSAP